MREIGTVTRQQSAALAGVAPYDDDSGDPVGARRIDLGRKRLRKSIYIAARPPSVGTHSSTQPTGASLRPESHTTSPSSPAPTSSLSSSIPSSPAAHR